MKNKSTRQSGFLKFRVSLILLLFSAGVLLALLGSGLFAAAEEQQAPAGEFRHSVRSVLSQRCLTGAARSSGDLAS